MNLESLNETMLKNLKHMQEQINDLNKRICDLADVMHSESQQGISDNLDALTELGDSVVSISDDNTDAIIDLGDMVAELDNRVSELENK